MKVKIGQYFRTKQGYIAKLIRVDNYLGNMYFDNPIWKKSYIPITYISFNNFNKKVREDVEPSTNVIDMIEIGDYVNGSRVIEIYSDNLGKCVIVEEPDNDGECISFCEKEIKTIVTKERFKSLECEVKEC